MPFTTRARLAAGALVALGLLAPTAAQAASLDLSSYRNHVGICHTPLDTCNFDEVGYGYAATALTLAGVEGGSEVTADGITYTWPDVAAGVMDNVTLNGQKIPVSAGDATRVGLLGAAHHGPVSTTVVLRYRDIDEAGATVERTVPHTVTFADWTLNGGGQQAPASNTIAITTQYRAFAPAIFPTTTYVFATSVPIDGSMELIAIELPREKRIRLFDIALG